MHEQHEADWPDNKHLYRVPDEQKHEQVEPARAAGADEVDADARGQEIRQGEQHRWHTPLEASAGPDGVEQDVGGREAAQEVAGADAEGPEQSDYGT
jgi:hypothetical protein